MVDRDVIFAKVGAIQNCLNRIRSITGLNPDSLADWDVQDVYVLNLQRAAQAAIDLAAHVVSDDQLGVPSNLRENFQLLANAGIIDAGLERKMIGLVGFRNIAVHDYQSLRIDILQRILTDHLYDFEEFYQAILVYTRNDEDSIGQMNANQD